MTVPPSHVLTAFGCTGSPVPLPGGGGGSFACGSVVLKPADANEETNWIAQTLLETDQVGFRIPRPLRSGDGAWVADGWTAWERLPGEHRQDRWAETIAVCRAYHHALRHLPRPAFFDARDDVFSRADRIAWNEAPIDCRPPVRETLERLDALRRPLDLPCQVIHGDVTANSGYCPDRWLAVRASSSPDINTSISRRIVSARKTGGRRVLPLTHPAVARAYLRWCSAGIVL